MLRRVGLAVAGGTAYAGAVFGGYMYTKYGGDGGGGGCGCGCDGGDGGGGFCSCFCSCFYSCPCSVLPSCLLHLPAPCSPAWLPCAALPQPLSLLSLRVL